MKLASQLEEGWLLSFEAQLPHWPGVCDLLLGDRFGCFQIWELLGFGDLVVDVFPALSGGCLLFQEALQHTNLGCSNAMFESFCKVRPDSSYTKPTRLEHKALSLAACLHGQVVFFQSGFGSCGAGLGRDLGEASKILTQEKPGSKRGLA